MPSYFEYGRTGFIGPMPVFATRGLRAGFDGTFRWGFAFGIGFAFMLPPVWHNSDTRSTPAQWGLPGARHRQE